MKNPVIILRMTNNCNLNCKYCYDKRNHFDSKMENYKIKSNLNQIVDNIVKIFQDDKSLSKIIFHGGEPLLVEPQVYERLILKILEFRPNTKFSIQTNGTLLNNKFIDIFEKYNVNIGISIDGFDENTNKYRIFKNGKNSFEKVKEKIDLLNERNIKFGTIISLSKEITGHEEELYDFIDRNNLSCSIRPIFINSLRI